MTCCTHAALSHTYDTTARANVGRCLSPGCSCGGESARNPLPVREKSAVTWDNGALTKDGPGDSLLAQRAEVPGPRPTLQRSAEL